MTQLAALIVIKEGFVTMKHVEACNNWPNTLKILTLQAKQKTEEYVKSFVKIRPLDKHHLSFINKYVKHIRDKIALLE